MTIASSVFTYNCHCLWYYSYVARSDKLMTKLKRLPTTMLFSEVSRVVQAHGYSHVRTSGSHNVFRNSEGHVLNIPTNNGRDVKRVYLREIVETLGLED